MDIQSARALKSEIASEVVPPAVSAINAAGGFSVTTFALHKMTKAVPLVALGVAPGEKHGDVKLAVRLQRHSLERSSSLVENIRKRAKDEVDIRFVGRIAKHAAPWYRMRQRPLQPGSSVGHFQITAGTIGAIAKKRKTNRDVILSNNHVLANENNAKAGDAILQEGARQGQAAVGPRCQADKMGGFDAEPGEPARCRHRHGYEIDRRRSAQLSGHRQARGRPRRPLVPGMEVSKVGRTTGVTHGRISAIEVDKVVIEYDLGSLSFDNQVEIESTGTGAFSAGGDSGSLILDDENRGCALLFAGSETGGGNGRGLTYANPIAIILKRLAIDLQGN
jgi:hypothetical protein